MLAVVDRSGEAVLWVGRQWVGWIFWTCGIAVEADGLENVDPRQPCVFMSNHQSVVDVGALVLTLPVSWRFVAKRELVWVPFFGWAMWLGGHVIINRGNRESAIASLRRAAKRLRGGMNVIIFPEGTRSETGEMREFKSGGFHLALEAQGPDPAGHGLGLPTPDAEALAARRERARPRPLRQAAADVRPRARGSRGAEAPGPRGDRRRLRRRA